ncbi:Crossover junction endonuclease mus81 [Puccinia graminis f. sp. tritici]|uniref:Crossover junction endonuclease MUS81 n=1 Tax=Puccinia graminis f. sp. tritici TaxID=56615 RepID=A0A5B0RS56_PUCGR|nr:Crossover junction endonuclease mus81 [Puccinia graminis f. sp. tritici]
MRIPTEYIVFKVRDSRGRCETGVFPVLDSEYQYHQSSIVIPIHILRPWRRSRPTPIRTQRRQADGNQAPNPPSGGTGPISAGYQNRISPLDRLFKPSSSGSARTAGSVVSIPSEANPAAPKDLAPSARLKPPSRPGSCEILWSGAALPETVAGWRASESPNSLPVSGAVNSLASSCTLVDLSCKASNLSHQSSSLDRSSSSFPLRNLKRTTSALSESWSSSDGLPSNRTRVNLKRTPSGLSESLLSRATDDVQPEVWKVGSYDICLVLDHREVRAINDRNTFYNLCVEKASALASPGQPPIRVLQRALVLGDAIWIAVHRDSQRKVVLDSIVKRKRLDDLCASIKDNRFEEQKARLKRSGLRDPIYLVEAYNTQSNLDSYGQMICTSKFETMLLNDFQLEATPDWKASVEFLVRRSKVLRDLHQEFEGEARGGTIAEMMLSANVKDKGKRRRKFRHSVMGMQVSDKTSQPGRLPCAPYFPRLAVYTRKPNRRHRLGGACSRA